MIDVGCCSQNSNHFLLEKLESWSMSRSSSPTMRNSLMSELELSTSDSDTSLQRTSRQICDIIDEEVEEEFVEFDEIITTEVDTDNDKISDYTVIDTPKERANEVSNFFEFNCKLYLINKQAGS